MQPVCEAYLHQYGTACVLPPHAITEPHRDHLGREADPVAEQAWDTDPDTSMDEHQHWLEDHERVLDLVNQLGSAAYDREREL